MTCIPFSNQEGFVALESQTSVAKVAERDNLSCITKRAKEALPLVPDQRLSHNCPEQLPECPTAVVFGQLELGHRVHHLISCHVNDWEGCREDLGMLNKKPITYI